MVFCTACGAEIHETAPFCPKCGAPQRVASAGDGLDRSFIGSIKICFSKYVGFSGRAPRAEFWWWYLFTVLIGIVMLIINGPTYMDYFSAMSQYTADSGLPPPTLSSPGIDIGYLINLALFLPGLAVSVRRLHDTNRSGWWMLILLIPLIGPILLLVWFCTRGTRGNNRFGADQLPAF